MRDLAIFMVVFSLLPIIFVRTSIGIYLWNWIGLMNPHRLTWGLAYHFKFAYLIGAVTLVSFVFSRDRRPLPNLPVVWSLIAFIIWMNITTYFALVPDAAYINWAKVMKIQLFIFVALSVMQSKDKIHALLWVMALSIGFYGIKGGIFTILSGGNYLVLGPAQSQIADNNTLALSLIMIVPIFWYLTAQTKKVWLKRLSFIFTVLIIASIFGSHSRGAFLAFGMISLVFFFKTQHKFKMLALFLLVIPLLLYNMPKAWFDRMETIKTYDHDASALGRINAWHFAYNLAKARPAVGGGFDVFKPGLFEIYAPNPKDYHDAHSIYFEVLAEHGFIGLTLFIILIFFSWRTGSRIRTLTRGDPDKKWAYDLASMMQVSIAGYLVGGAFLGLAYFDLFYCLLSALILTLHVVEKGDQVYVPRLSRPAFARTVG